MIVHGPTIGYNTIGEELMKRALIVFAVLAMLACATRAVNAQELLSNGNLDLTYPEVIVDNAPPGPGAEDFFLPKPQVWLNTGSRTISGPYEDEMSSEPWAGPAPTPVTTDGLLNGPHPEGCGGPDCAVFFKPFSGSTANGAATGNLTQDVAAVPNRNYVMTGWAGAEANALMAGAEFALEFLDSSDNVIGGSVLNLLPTLFVDNGEPFDYKQYTLSAISPAGTVEARVRASMIGALSNPAGGGQAFVIDDFSLQQIPEPTSVLLLVGGALGMFGFARRR
jgi:hypothetical protein